MLPYREQRFTEPYQRQPNNCSLKYFSDMYTPKITWNDTGYNEPTYQPLRSDFLFTARYPVKLDCAEMYLVSFGTTLDYPCWLDGWN